MKEENKFAEMKIDNGELDNAVQEAEKSRGNQNEKTDSSYDYFVSYNKGADIIDNANSRS